MAGKPLVAQAHAAVMPALAPGAVAVDATAGNGHDTLFLARAVGPQGRVYALDLQAAAIEATRRRLAAAGLGKGVQLVRQGHQHLPEPLPPQAHGRVAAVMFNLGYLPGGDHARVTRPEDTLAALDGAAGLLAESGRITVVAYTGHPGGWEEAEAVAAWAARLAPGAFTADWIEGGGRAAPRLLVVERRPSL